MCSAEIKSRGKDKISVKLKKIIFNVKNRSNWKTYVTCSQIGSNYFANQTNSSTRALCHF